MSAGYSANVEKEGVLIDFLKTRSY